MRNRPWTPEEEQFLIDSHATHTVVDQAAHLQRSEASILGHRRALIAAGQLRIVDRRPWTAEESARALEMLRDGAVPRRVAAALHRTRDAVVVHIKRHYGSLDEVRWPREGARVRTLGALATLFTVNHEQVIRWIDWGWLRAQRTSRKRGARTLISDSAIWEFIANRETWIGWTPAHITDPDWQEQAQWFRDRAGGQWLTTRQAARQAGCGQTTIGNSIRAKQIPAIRRGKEHWFVWSADIERWKKEQANVNH